MDAPILLYDGNCNLCNFWVRFVLATERASELRFAPLKSSAGRDVLASAGVHGEGLDSLVFVEQGEAYIKTNGVVRICHYLRVPWSFGRYLKFFPQKYRDYLYDFVARRRYQWFGRIDECPLPSAEQRARFLS